jgi:hypothetical protein
MGRCPRTHWERCGELVLPEPVDFSRAEAGGDTDRRGRRRGRPDRRPAHDLSRTLLEPGGTARQTAEAMVRDAVVQRLAPICVVQSGRDPARAPKLIALKDESAWQRGEYVGK